MTYLLRSITVVLITLVSACATAETTDEDTSGRALGTLNTADYEVTLVSHCAEGEVTCARIVGQLLDHESDQTVALNGSTLHRLCADGQTPCRFLGYELTGEEYEYRILENGQLTIKRCDELGCEAIYNARGSWRY